MGYEPEKYYHVYNRGVKNKDIFHSPENYRYCLQLLHKYAVENNISVLAYCLMPDHYHIMLQQHGDGSIQHCLQATFKEYTQSFNQEHKRSGTLFQGRAKAHEVDNDLYIVQLCAYIHLHPVSAQLTNTPEEWEFTDYKEWIDIRQSDFTDLSLRNSFFDNGKQYRNFIESQSLEPIGEKFNRLKLEQNA